MRIVFDFDLLAQPEFERNMARQIMRHCIRQFTQRDQQALSSRRVAASFNKAPQPTEWRFQFRFAVDVVWSRVPELSTPDHPDHRVTRNYKFMGTTTWDYFVPYDDDVGGALQRLREQVFREGRYERFTCSADELKPYQDVPGIVDPTAPFEKQMQKQEGESILQWGVRIQKLLDQFAGESPKGEPDYSKTPRTVDELLEEQGESGTHSILDIQRISPVPEFGAVSPMPAERLSEIFGTDKPTREMVESKQGDVDLVEDPFVSERLLGIYFTVYRDGKPDEIFFMGTSGD